MEQRNESAKGQSCIPLASPLPLARHGQISSRYPSVCEYPNATIPRAEYSNRESETASRYRRILRRESSESENTKRVRGGCERERALVRFGQTRRDFNYALRKRLRVYGQPRNEIDRRGRAALEGTDCCAIYRQERGNEWGRNEGCNETSSRTERERERERERIFLNCTL